MKVKIKSGLIYGLGGFLVIIGIIGLFLPILQGVIFIALGLYVLSLRSERAKLLLEKVLHKFPFIHNVRISFLNWFKNLRHKINFF